jgi:exopolyphosphatase/pppGpp-phosphohydrolase
MCESTMMTTRVFELVRRRVLYAFESGRERFFPLEAERIDLLQPGLVLMKSMIDLISADTFHVVARDLRWAVIARENGRIDNR